jgi:hypothetical protein
MRRIAELRPLGVERYVLPDADTLNAALRTLLIRLAAESPGRETNNPRGTSYFANKWLSARDLHLRPEPAIATLVRDIECLARASAWPGIADPATLMVSAMWGIVSEPGMTGSVHSHNGQVSGAYYVDVGAAGRDAGGAFTLHDAADRMIERLYPEAGDLLLFPSSLRHGVERYTGARPRIVVSFNLRV